MIIEFIGSLPQDEYEVVNSANHSVFKLNFSSFEFFSSQSNLDSLNEHIDFFRITGEYSDGGEIKNSEIFFGKELKVVKFTFHTEKIADFLYTFNELDETNSHIKIIYSINDFNSISLLEHAKRKSLYYVCPFLELNINNDLVCFTNSSDFSVRLKDPDINKLNSIRKNSTILWDDFILPEYYLFEESDYNSLPPSFKSQYVFLTIISFMSNLRKGSTCFHIGINGYKSILFKITKEEFEIKVQDIHIHSVSILYEWIFNELKSSDVRLSILRNLLSIDSNDADDVITKFQNPAALLNSCKHQFELIINESIKDHFEYLDKIVSKIRDTVNDIDAQINKLTNSIITIVIGITGLLLANMNNETVTNKSFPPIYSFILIVYLVYQRFFSFKNLKLRKDDIHKHFLFYRDTVQNKLKIIEKSLVEELLNKPINSSIQRFDKTYKNSSRMFSIVIFAIFIFFITQIL